MSDNRPKILFITPQPYFQWRGSPIRVSFNMLALSESGYEVDLLCLPFGEEHQTPHVRVLRVGTIFGLRDIPIGPSIWKAFFSIKLWWRARQLVRENSYAFIHVVEDAGWLGVWLARRTGAKLIFEKHSDPASYRKGSLRNAVMWLYGVLEAFVIRRADAVIGTGPGLVAQARHLAPQTPAHHIFDIASSLKEPDLERVAARRADLQRSPDEVLIMYVGSFAVYQGIDLIFGAIPMVCADTPQARFVIIGGSSEEIATRREALGRAADAVTFAGKIHPDQLPDYLAAADVLLSTRISGNNTPLKLLDYLKAGRSILAVDSEANRLILDEKLALFTAPTVPGVAEGIRRLVREPVLRDQLASAGRALIDAHYNYAGFKQRLADVYRTLTA
jgi:glycosyltransferase involved in cell wall biosynthesis